MDKQLDDLVREMWGDERPIWVFCPICDGVLDGEGVLNGFGTRTCAKCDYKYQQQGSYASMVTIQGKRFGLDDMFDDREAMYARIAELKQV